MLLKLHRTFPGGTRRPRSRWRHLRRISHAMETLPTRFWRNPPRSLLNSYSLTATLLSRHAMATSSDGNSSTIALKSASTPCARTQQLDCLREVQRARKPPSWLLACAKFCTAPQVLLAQCGAWRGKFLSLLNAVAARELAALHAYIDSASAGLAQTSSSMADVAETELLQQRLAAECAGIAARFEPLREKYRALARFEVHLLPMRREQLKVNSQYEMECYTNYSTVNTSAGCQSNSGSKYTWRVGACVRI